MVRKGRLWTALLCLFPAAACKDNSGPGVQPCAAANARLVSLGVGQHVSVNPDTGSGCIMFPANTGTAEAEYLVVAQAATGVPGRTLNFVLQGGTEPLAAPAPPLAAAGRLQAAPGGAADRFHRFLRLGEESRAWGELRPGSAPFMAARAAPALVAKPTVGEMRSFSVCSKLDCSEFTPVGAEAQAVGQRLAIFVDTQAPVALSPQDLDTLITLFDTRLYQVDRAAFGAESDVNRDSVVIVLMTNVVNRLVTAQECQATGFVSGFFLGADIDPAYANDGRVNHAEVFYAMVPDPAATLSCAHSVSQVKTFVPITFIHEFQHMINYNQHVLVRGRNGEQLWLNEGLSHYAEELGGRAFLAEGNSQTFTSYVIGDLYNAYKFLERPGDHFLLPKAGIGTLEERGAQWLFVRFLVDQFAADTTGAAWDAFTQELVQTGDTGAANVQAATGMPFATSVSRWSLANWVDDLPSFATPAELRYDAWNFRSVFAQLNAQNPTRYPRAFPLVPTSSEGSAVDVSGTLRAGSGVYHRALQAAGAPPFLLTFRAPDGWILAPSHSPRLNVIRLR